jgi:hypothetical protein
MIGSMAVRRGVALLVVATALVTGGCTAAAPGASSGGPVPVEIAFRNHPPVQAVLKDVDAVIAKYGDKVSVSRHDVDVADSETFMKDKDLTNTCVLAIYVRGSMTYPKDGSEVKFYSFPVGRGTAVTAAGNWTIDDLDSALAQATTE